MPYSSPLCPVLTATKCFRAYMRWSSWVLTLWSWEGPPFYMCVCAIHSNSRFETFFAIFYTEDFESKISQENVDFCSLIQYNLGNNSFINWIESEFQCRSIFWYLYELYFERENKRFTKVSFFWAQILDMSSSDWLTYLVHQLEACVFGGKLLTWTHVLTLMSEKIDFSLSFSTPCRKPMSLDHCSYKVHKCPS